MRILKNRGDIFFSKTNKKKSTEQKILLISLVFIILFTVVFVIFTGIKSDFSIKNFFAPENLDINENVTDNEISLPQISGKDNFLIMVSDDDKLLFSYLLQVDKDATAYKITTLKSETLIDGKSIASIYSSAGEKNMLSAVESLLDIKFDYYISFSRDKFIDIFDEMGFVKYPIIEEIKYKNSNSPVPYSLRLKSGEQTIRGGRAVDLVRYYLDNNMEGMANDFLLNSLAQQINSENYEKKEQLFQLFIKDSNTDITVKEFFECDDALMVLSSPRAGLKIYNAPAEYKDNLLTNESKKLIKGYFVK